MKTAHVLSASMASLVSLAALVGTAQAQTTNFNCNDGSGGHCLLVANGRPNNATSVAILATSNNADGIRASTSGTSNTADGVQGESLVGNGVLGISSSAGASGVFGFNQSGGFGVAGRATGAGTAVFGDNTASNGFAGNFNGRVNVETDLTVKGVPRANQSNFTLLSDVRLKTNVKPLQGSLAKLLALRGVTYEWKDPARHGNLQGPQMGFIAQEVEKVFPSWVAANAQGEKAITIRGLDAMVVESIRTLKNENDELRSRLEALEGKRTVSKAGFAQSPLALGALILLVGAVLMVSRRRDRRPHA